MEEEVKKDEEEKEDEERQKSPSIEAKGTHYRDKREGDQQIVIGLGSSSGGSGGGC